MQAAPRNVLDRQAGMHARRAPGAPAGPQLSGVPAPARPWQGNCNAARHAAKANPEERKARILRVRDSPPEPILRAAACGRAAAGEAAHARGLRGRGARVPPGNDLLPRDQCLVRGRRSGVALLVRQPVHRARARPRRRAQRAPATARTPPAGGLRSLTPRSGARGWVAVFTPPTESCVGLLGQARRLGLTRLDPGGCSDPWPDLRINPRIASRRHRRTSRRPRTSSRSHPRSRSRRATRRRGRR
jgi:hypothetical protein